MNKRAMLEVIAPTVEEAIANGLSQLGIAEEAVDVEVLDSGSKGLFGIGSRLARVRLTIKAVPGEQAAPAIPTEEPSRPSPKPEPLTVQEPSPVSAADLEQELAEEEPLPDVIERSPAEVIQEEYILEIARDTVTELLEQMHVTAEINAYFGKPDDPRSRVPICVDISGKDLSILIGRQAEILNALQYITNLIVGKELGHSVPLVVDVEGYRKRREQQLRQLAQRMADQAIKTGRRQTLEPMPANERRIIHIELRENKQVITESVGVDPRRKVTIRLVSS